MYGITYLVRIINCFFFYFQADANGIISLLIPILQGVSNDELQCRGCRLVGNLAQTHSIAKKLHEHKIVPCIVDILNSSTSSVTIVLGIRALRWEWYDYNSAYIWLT